MDKKFSKEHEWLTLDNGVGTIGISDYAQKELGDVVYVALTKDIGESVEKGEEIGEIESVKSVSQIYSPVSGEIVEFNEVFEDEEQSGIINEDPYGKGWIFKIKLTDESELDSMMSEAKYKEYIDTL